MKYKTLGTEGFLGAVAIAGVLTLLYFFLGANPVSTADLGVCLPSPNLWNIPPVWSWGINIGLIMGSAVALIFFNKSYSVIQSTDTVLPSLFLLLTVTNPWASGELGSSTLMVMTNLLCLATIFSCYKSTNATQETFVVATMLSLGSMFQYAFIFLMPGYILIGFMMKCFRFRELAAFLMGVAAPYWIVIGMGLVPVEAFHFPTFTQLWEGVNSTTDIFVGVLNIGLTALVAVMLALNNAVKLYAGNTQRRLYNNAISVLGLICIAGMAFDYNNLPTYLATFYLAAAFQIANTFALWNIRKGHIWLGIIVGIYLTFFLIMVL